MDIAFVACLTGSLNEAGAVEFRPFFVDKIYFILMKINRQTSGFFWYNVLLTKWFFVCYNILSDRNE